jgi:DNA-binding beta-propeller fold protein YncE
MLARYRAGRQTEALQAYQDGRRLLQEEVGLEPSPTLRRLERAILAQDPTLTAPTRQAEAAAHISPRFRRRHTKVAALLLVGVVTASAIAAVLLGRSRDGSAPSLRGYENAVGVIDARSNAVVDAVPVGNTPSSIVLSPGAAWTLNADDRTISRIDRQTRKLVSKFGTGSTPTGLAVGYGSLWVGDSSSSIARFDLQTGRRTTTIQLPRDAPAGGRAGESHIALAAGSAWAINRDGSVSRIDTRTNEIVATVHGIVASAIAAGDEGIWAIDQSRSAVARISARSNRVAQSIHLTAGSLNDIAVGAGSIWATDPFGGLLWRVDPGPPSLTKTIDVGPGGATVDADGQAVWVVNHLDDKLLKIDPRTNDVVPIAVGAPQNVAASSGLAWVVKARPQASCGALASDGRSSPDLVIVSDLPLQGFPHIETQAMAAAAAFVVKQRRFKAGKYTVGYRSCDDSTPQAGGFDFEKCGTNAKAYAADPSIVGVVGAYDSFCSGIEIRMTSRSPARCRSSAQQTPTSASHVPDPAPGRASCAFAIRRGSGTTCA